MREIKFRAWDKENKEMIYPSNEITLSGEFNGEQYEQVVPAWSYSETSERIFMQYTGLKDKNGREIFESDILRLKRKIEGYPKNPIVSWASGRWGLQNQKGNKNFEIHGSLFDEDNPEILDECEIIGNIYETPFA